MEKEKKYCVYKILDLRTDEIIYIGKSCDFKMRKSAHFTHDKRPIDKYMFDEGRHNFEMSIIQDNIETNDEAVKIEDNYILEYQPFMNKQRSGNISKDLKEYHNTDKWREHHREYLRDYRNTDKWREYNRNYQKSEKMKEYYREYNKSDKKKDYNREYYRKKKLEKNNQLN